MSVPTIPRSRLALVLAAALWLAPGVTHADSGASSLELGAGLTFLRLPPPVGTADPILGSSLDLVFGVRRALSNHIEVSVSALKEFSADYCHDNTQLTTAGSNFKGTLCATTNRWAVTAGARYVAGLTWRRFAGLDVGWSRRNFEKLDLIDVANPSNPVTFGLPLKDSTVNQILVAPTIGLEWSITDHASLLLAPRLEVAIGGNVTTLALTVPLTFSWSWYGLL